MNYNVATIDEYINVIPLERKEIVVKLISIVKEYFPELKGNMKYKLPSFTPICAISSQKNYVSFYVHQFNLINKYREELGNLKVGKSCIRLKNRKQLPEKTIRKILSEIRSKK